MTSSHVNSGRQSNLYADGLRNRLSRWRHAVAATADDGAAEIETNFTPGWARATIRSSASSTSASATRLTSRRGRTRGLADRTVRVIEDSRRHYTCRRFGGRASVGSRCPRRPSRDCVAIRRLDSLHGRLARPAAGGARPQRPARRDTRDRHRRPWRELRRGRADLARALARQPPDPRPLRGRIGAGFGRERPRPQPRGSSPAHAGPAPGARGPFHAWESREPRTHTPWPSSTFSLQPDGPRVQDAMDRWELASIRGRESDSLLPSPGATDGRLKLTMRGRA